jgi:N utilization substance protein A
VKLSVVLDELVEEKGLDRATLGNIICEGMLAAYERKYPGVPLQIKYDDRADDLQILVEKTVVNTVEDEDTQISLKKARHIDSTVNEGGIVVLPFDQGIGRIEILRAKQIIAGKIRKMEADIVYNEFKKKEGTIIYGTIHKVEPVGVTVKIQDHLAFLPRSLSIPTDKYIVGHTMRALLKEVLPEPRNENQLILDRASDNFLRALFELEIPEIFERIISIKKIVRIPGYKAKVAVISTDKNIDPVGTCVGVGGVRIRPILKELGGEKIDIIEWTDSLTDLVQSALKPAQVNRVEITDEKSALVWLDEDQRSLAIGRLGQNISLASRLVGLEINLVASRQAEEDNEE